MKKNDENSGARSYKSEVIGGDSFAVTINFKWLLQIIAATAVVVYGWYQLETRIQHLERNMVAVVEQVEIYDQERQAAEQAHLAQMEERMLWYESELNLNPFSWGKKKK